MTQKLAEIATGKLLSKFGEGKHKPGSGSASALQGMLSAQLILTVIDLTNHPKRRKKYAEDLPELLRIKGQIESRIYPGLEKLFEDDSVQFGVVITLRRERNDTKDHEAKEKLAERALEALKPATEMPLQIAEFSVELGEYAIAAFYYGFQSARGDSGVAFNSAISAIAGCLSIVKLNLLSFADDAWVHQTNQRAKEIKDRYEILLRAAAEAQNSLEKEVEGNIVYHQSIAEFKRGGLAASVQSNEEIENIVRRLQNQLWKHRETIWSDDILEDHPLLILKPEVVLEKVLGYTYEEKSSLGFSEIEGERFETAGLIDKNKKLVQVSRKFPPESRSFTAAHELGHAILHEQMLLHRDKSIDGSSTGTRSSQEQQADKFATYFLMPANQVVDVFGKLFETQKIRLDARTALALKLRTNVLMQKCRNQRELARLIASTEYYAGNAFKSIAKVFGVSVETMAIRLEELNLFE